MLLYTRQIFVDKKISFLYHLVKTDANIVCKVEKMRHIYRRKHG